MELVLARPAGNPSAAAPSAHPPPAGSYLALLGQSARLVHPTATPGDLARRMLHCALHFCHLPHSRRLLEFLSAGRMAEIARENPSLFRKLTRPYVSLAWPAGAKVAAIMHHYAFLDRRIQPGPFRRAVSPTGLELLTISTGLGDRLMVRLRYDGKFRKEGETTLDLESSRHGGRISSFTFVVAQDAAGAPVICVGAVYGLPAGADRDIIRQAARGLCGLRPKALLLLVLQELARSWAVGTLLGVGDRMHTSRHLIYRLNRSRQFALTYSDFWTESGGTVRGDGFFLLPLTAGPRDLQTVKPGRRAQYRRRQALVDGLLSTVRLRLETLGGASASCFPAHFDFVA